MGPDDTGSIYTEGSAASKCPEGWMGETATGLCVKEGAVHVTTTTTSVHSETTVGSTADPVRNKDIQTTTAAVEVTTDAPIVCLKPLHPRIIQIYFQVTSTTAPSIETGCENGEFFLEFLRFHAFQTTKSRLSAQETTSTT